MEYLGLRRGPGSARTPADRVGTALVLVAVLTTLFATKDLGFWVQMGVVVGVSICVGVLVAAILTWLRRRPPGRRGTR